VRQLTGRGRARLSSARRGMTGSRRFGDSRRAEDRRALPNSVMPVMVPSGCAQFQVADIDFKFNGSAINRTFNVAPRPRSPEAVLRASYRVASQTPTPAPKDANNLCLRRRI